MSKPGDDDAFPPGSDKTVIVASTRGARTPGDATHANARAGNEPGASASSSAPAQNVLPAGTRLGEFEVLGLIGEGGFGIVYLAFDTSLGRNVALKEYMPSALAARVSATQVRVKSERHESTFRAGLQSFINEARLLAQFDHHSLVKVYRFWEANGTAYMVMPLYQGVTLKQALKAMHHPPDEAWLRTLLAPLLEALSVLHESKCYHRDIAPDNVILLSGSNRPVLLDFGAARRVIGDMTQALTVILKPGYAPIEQYAEVPSLKQGSWSDQYALAAMVYYAITGKTPPPAVGRMVSDSYQPLARVAAGKYSVRFLRAIDHALAVMPADRPQTAKQFAGELGIVIETPARREDGLASDGVDAGVGARGKTRAKTKTKTKAKADAELKKSADTRSSAPSDAAPHRRALTALAAAAVLIAGAAGGWWFFVQDHGTSSTRATLATEATRARLATDAASGANVAAQSSVGGGEPVSNAKGLANGANPPKEANTASGSNPSSASNSQNLANALNIPNIPNPPGTSNPLSASNGPLSSRSTSPASTSPPLAPFTAASEFDRVAALADPSIQLKVELPTPRAVIDKDKLRFALTSNRAGYVYVFVVDPDGQYLQLFPNELDHDNQIFQSRKLVLPRPSWPMLAGDPPGANHFLAIVSAAPRDFSALGMTHDSVFSSLPMPAQEAAALHRTIHSSPFAGVSACSEGASACARDYGAATFKIDIVRSSK
jgi:serine/threonine protein kinase